MRHYLLVIDIKHHYQPLQTAAMDDQLSSKTMVPTNRFSNLGWCHRFSSQWYFGGSSWCWVEMSKVHHTKVVGSWLISGNRTKIPKFSWFLFFPSLHMAHGFSRFMKDGGNIPFLLEQIELLLQKKYFDHGAVEDASFFNPTGPFPLNHGAMGKKMGQIWHPLQCVENLHLFHQCRSLVWRGLM